MLFHLLYHADVRFVDIVPIIVDPYSQYFAYISFQRLRVLPVFEYWIVDLKRRVEGPARTTVQAGCFFTFRRIF